MKYVDYVHSKGLLFGMYSAPASAPRADYPGSFDHEFLDAETFAEYGVDFQIRFASSRKRRTVRCFTDAWAWRSAPADAISSSPPATGA